MSKKKQNPNPSRFDFNGLTEYFPVFVSGTHKDSKGVEKTWTNDDLDEFIATHEAQVAEGGLYNGFPFVVGHPQINDPAFGWGASLKREGDTLFAKGDKVATEFEAGVEAGNWPNRSVRIVKTKHGMGIGHVGFLGAKPPAIEGMDAVHSYTAEAADEHYDFVASPDWYTPNVIARFMRRLRDYFIAEKGQDEADRLVPDYEIEAMSNHANDLMNDPETSPQFSDQTDDDPTIGDQTVTPEEHQAAIDAAVKKAEDDAAAEAAELRTKLAAQTRKNSQAEFSAFIDGTNLTPAQATGAVDFMLQLSDAEEAQFEFSAGDDTEKKTTLQWFKDFVGALPKQVPTGESDAGDRDATDFGNADDVADAIHEYQASQLAKGITVSASEALAAIKREGKK